MRRIALLFALSLVMAPAIGCKEETPAPAETPAATPSETPAETPAEEPAK